MLHFNMRIIPVDGKYGLDDCLTNKQGEALVEFYDARYTDTALGQFVTRYHVTTFMQHSDWLALDFGIPEWTMTADQVRAAQATIRGWMLRG